MAITVTMLQPASASATRTRPAIRRPVRRRLRHVGIVAGALTASAVLSGLLWLLAQVVQWVQANWIPVTCLAAVGAIIFGAAQETRR